MNDPAVGAVRTLRSSGWPALWAAILIAFAASSVYAKGEAPSPAKIFEASAKLLGLLGGAIA